MSDRLFHPSQGVVADTGLRICLNQGCGKMTIKLEAESRLFNTGFCACGGELYVYLEAPR